MYDKCSGSKKITTHLDHVSHCKPTPDTNRSNRWTDRVFIINTRRDSIPSKFLRGLRSPHRRKSNFPFSEVAPLRAPAGRSDGSVSCARALGRDHCTVLLPTLKLTGVSKVVRVYRTLAVYPFRVHKSGYSPDSLPCSP